MKKGRKDLFAEQIRFLNEIPAIDLSSWVSSYAVSAFAPARGNGELENDEIICVHP